MPLANTFASIFFKSNRRRVDLYTKYPDETQFKVFNNLVKTAQNTEIGKRHNFKEILSLGPQAFADRVPVNTYEGIKADIERVAAGEDNILWPSKTKWFAMSSGTTDDRSKYIPITTDSLHKCHFNGGTDVLAVYLKSNPQTTLFKGKTLAIGGSRQINRLGSDTFCGDLSAVLISNLPYWVRKRRTPGLEIALMENWDEKLEKMAQAKYSHSSNYWKKFIEANKSLKEQKTVEEKQAQERAFMQWVNANPARKAEYGTVLDSIKYACENLARFEKMYYYVIECVLNNGMEFFNPAYYAMQSLAKIADKEELRAKADEFFKDYNKPTDYKVSKAMAKTLLENVTPAEIEKYFGEEIAKYFTQYGDPEILIDTVFQNSTILDKEGFYKILDDTLGVARLTLMSDHNS